MTSFLFFVTESVPDSKLPMLHFTCGVTAGMMASLITQPADVLKTHMQLYPHRYGRLRNAVKFVYEVSDQVLLLWLSDKCLNLVSHLIEMLQSDFTDLVNARISYLKKILMHCFKPSSLRC